MPWHALLTTVTWLHNGNTFWACALYHKMAYLGHTQSLTHRTHPWLRSCQDNGKLACHCTARYKMEWIYTQTKMSDQGSLELALIMRKKEWQLAIFLNIWFWHVRWLLVCWSMRLVDKGLCLPSIHWRWGGHTGMYPYMHSLTLTVVEEQTQAADHALGNLKLVTVVAIHKHPNSIS